MAYLEQAVTDFGGIAMRYGAFYGAANDGTIEPVRKRQFPIVGDGGGVWSWIHLDDAASATVLALNHDGPAIFNVVDDDPAPVREWLPVLAERPRGEAAAARPPLARAGSRRRGGDRDVHAGARGLEREGQARARLDAARPHVAHRVRGGLLGDRRSRPEGAQAGAAAEPLTEQRGGAPALKGGRPASSSFEPEPLSHRSRLVRRYGETTFRRKQR